MSRIGQLGPRAFRPLHVKGCWWGWGAREELLATVFCAGMLDTLIEVGSQMP